MSKKVVIKEQLLKQYPLKYNHEELLAYKQITREALDLFKYIIENAGSDEPDMWNDIDNLIVKIEKLEAGE